MNNIPEVGGARGIFEIFIPGTFLLLNLAVFMPLFPFIDTATKEFIFKCFSNLSNTWINLIFIICFGYLIGVVLRLLKGELADKLSAKWQQRLNRKARREDKSFELWAYEEFPYIGWIGKTCELYFPSETIDFYNRVWANRKREGQNRQFFNFCKTLINSVDERASKEIYSAEALSRYIASIFYAIVISSFLLVIAISLQFIILHKTMSILLLVLLGYCSAIIVILKNLRFIRIKEVEIVFSATFKNREMFERESLTADNIAVRE